MQSVVAQRLHPPRSVTVPFGHVWVGGHVSPDVDLPSPPRETLRVKPAVHVTVRMFT